VLNDLDPDGLADAIRNAKAGKAVINSRVGARLFKELRNRRDEPVNAFCELTDREMDVLRQIGAGKNNHEIAAALVISEKTVKAHVANFLTARRLPCLPGKKASCGAI
jgi:DNA-binding NarL/FixJ family response regulator